MISYLPLRLTQSVMILSSLSLFGCGGSDGEQTNSPIALTSMTAVAEGYQTFQTKVTAKVQHSNIQSASSVEGYVYTQSLYQDDYIDVEFTGVDDKDGQPVTLPAPEISKIVDINTRYSAFNMRNMNIDVAGTFYSGSFTLIQDKETGQLYPLVENGLPIYKRIDADHESWLTKTHFSNVGDESSLYLRHGEGKSLHVARFNGAFFSIDKVFDDYERNNWVLADGTIVSLEWNRQSLTWLSHEKQDHFTVDLTDYTNPFLYESELHIVNTNTQTLYTLNNVDGELLFTDQGWTIDTSYLTDANNNSVRRGEYEMLSDCSVYKFDQQSRTIVKLHSGLENSGFTPAAGQRSLFCVYSIIEENHQPPIFRRFNIDDESLLETTVLEGHKIDATERLVVISDNELMFYEYPVDNFHEFYVDFEQNDVSSREVEKTSIVKMQVVAE